MRWVALAYTLLSAPYLMPAHPAWLAPGTTGYMLWLDLTLVSGLVVIASLVSRVRQAGSSAQQEQMVWVLVAIGLATPVVVLGAPLPFINATLVWMTVIPREPFLLVVISLILAVGSITCGLVALLNYGHVDTDVLINRAIVYAPSRASSSPCMS
jgi:cytochrome c biogenesis factor